MILQKNITLEDVKKNVKPSSEKPTVWYSSRTAWWTDDPKDLQPGPVPLDVFGAPLFQGDLKKFIEGAEGHPEHYGPDGLNILMACHHKNFKVEATDGLKDYSGLEIFKQAFLRAKWLDKDFQLLTR